VLLAAREALVDHHLQALADPEHHRRGQHDRDERDRDARAVREEEPEEREKPAQVDRLARPSSRRA
jgi:hypothetical protein